MPSRIIIAGIFVFWLASVGLLFYREVLPRWRTESAPAYAIEITDEVGSPTAEWQMFDKDKLIGRGNSKIRRTADRNFEMSQTFTFTDLEINVVLAKMAVKRLESVYRVTPKGDLLGLEVKSKAGLKDAKGLIEFEAELTGDVVDGWLTPKLKLFGSPVELPGFGKIAIGEHGSILNPMHLVHRLPGLREGQHWRVPLLDPFKMFKANDLIGPALPFLDAEVVAAETTWNDRVVDCLKIIYREPGKDVVAATWVRRSDGLVLAQDARQSGYDISIRRVPN